MRTTLHDRHRCAQNADHLAHNSPFSTFFAEVVCTLGTTPPRTTISLPPIGGIGIIRGVTRRRHADSQLLMLQNPHRRQRGGHREHGEPGPSPMSNKSPATGPKGGPLPVQNSPRAPALAACAVQNSPCSPEMAQFGALSACRESFVPLWSAQHRAGRVLYRMRGRVGTSHDSTAHPTSTEGTGGTTGPRCRARG